MTKKIPVKNQHQIIPIVILEGVPLTLKPNKKYPCSHCGESFKGQDLEPNRYEPSVAICFNCSEDQLKEEESE